MTPRIISISACGPTPAGACIPSTGSVWPGLLAKLTADKPITSGTLRLVCPGSRKNGGFILAAIQREGLVKPIPDLPHGVMPVDSSAYLAEMTTLMQQGVAIQIPAPVNQRSVPLAKRPATKRVKPA